MRNRTKGICLAIGVSRRRSLFRCGIADASPESHERGILEANGHAFVARLAGLVGRVRLAVVIDRSVFDDSPLSENSTNADAALKFLEAPGQ